MNQKSKKRLALGAIFLAAIVIAAIIGFNWKQPGNELTIGVIFPLTGDAASYGEKGREAIDMAVSEVNAVGGCGGRKARVIFEDTRADPATGLSAIRKLINANRVPVVIGDIVSAVTLAAAPVAENNQVVLLSPTSSAPAITHAGEYIYRIWPSDLLEGKAIAELAIQDRFRKAAILFMNNDYGTSIAQIFKKTFEAGGGTVKTMEAYQADGTDFRSFLTKIQTEKPDVLYIAGYFADTAIIIRQAKELGFSVQILGTTAIEDNQFLKLAGEAAEGIIYPLATGFDPSSSATQVQKFVKNFRSRYGHDPGWVEAQCYDAFLLVCHAVAQIEGKITGTAMKRIFDSMGPYEGVAGVIKFDENGDVVKPIVYKTVRNHSFAPLSASSAHGGSR
jgi:branched-chain amino acid transport system substrate-binding protein